MEDRDWNPFSESQGSRELRLVIRAEYLNSIPPLLSSIHFHETFDVSRDVSSRQREETPTLGRLQKHSPASVGVWAKVLFVFSTPGTPKY